MLIIGDVHGKIHEYKKLIEKTKDDSIQLGDFGFYKEHQWHLDNMDSEKHRICFGNHDFLPFVYEKHSCGDFSYFSDKIMTVRGACSIDSHLRTEGLDWFRNEELSYLEMGEAIELYKKNKPKVVLSHDCPRTVSENIFHIQDKSLTSNGLQIMFEQWQPDLWIFGHHHRDIDVKIENTRFICLNELSTFVL